MPQKSGRHFGQSDREGNNMKEKTMIHGVPLEKVRQELRKFGLGIPNKRKKIK